MNDQIIDRITEHFQRSELTCPCCGELIEDDLFIRHMGKLEELRVLADFPIVVTSGHRCEKHNASIGGASDSMHLRFATDIRPGNKDPHDLRVLYRIALMQNWGGIGIYDSWVHLDMRDKQARWNNRTREWA